MILWNFSKWNKRYIFHIFYPLPIVELNFLSSAIVIVISIPINSSSGTRDRSGERYFS